MANDLIPFKRPGEDVTCKAEGAVTGMRCVQVSGDMTDNPALGIMDTTDGGLPVCGVPSTTGAAGAGKVVFGVAKYDAADTKRFGVAREGIVPIEVSAAIAAGAEVEVNANGTIKTLASGVSIGTCLTACTFTGSDIYAIVALRI